MNIINAKLRQIKLPSDVTVSLSPCEGWDLRPFGHPFLDGIFSLINQICDTVGRRSNKRLTVEENSRVNAVFIQLYSFCIEFLESKGLVFKNCEEKKQWLSENMSKNRIFKLFHDILEKIVPWADFIPFLQDFSKKVPEILNHEFDESSASFHQCSMVPTVHINGMFRLALFLIKHLLELERCVTVDIGTGNSMALDAFLVLLQPVVCHSFSTDIHDFPKNPGKPIHNVPSTFVLGDIHSSLSEIFKQIEDSFSDVPVLVTITAPEPNIGYEILALILLARFLQEHPEKTIFVAITAELNGCDGFPGLRDFLFSSPYLEFVAEELIECEDSKTRRAYLFRFKAVSPQLCNEFDGEIYESILAVGEKPVTYSRSSSCSATLCSSQKSPPMSPPKSPPMSSSSSAQLCDSSMSTAKLCSSEESITNKCALCDNDAPHNCKKCKKIYYCSRECQVQHWPKHKIECNK
jgi:hypothetical protein